MCGIFGCIVPETSAADMTLKGLKILEYRGYDSWGVAWIGSSSPEKISLQKEVGKIGLAQLSAVKAQVALGHTRWATHGGVTQLNAHPHLSSEGQIALVHNGIIENAEELRVELKQNGIRCLSQTDTEVAAQLLGWELQQHPDQAVQKTFLDVFSRLEGLNALVFIHLPTQSLWAVRSGSPLCLGRNKTQVFVTSDPLALVGHTEEVMYLPNGVVAHLAPKAVTAFFSGPDALPYQPTWEPMVLQSDEVSLGGEPHYLIKEIREQPEVLRRVATTDPKLLAEYAQWMGSGTQTLVGCGTALHAALLGQSFFGQIAGQRAQVWSGSEFGRWRGLLTPQDRVSFVSQSGETMDIVEHLEPLKNRGVPYAALVNRVGSTLDRQTQTKLYLNAGPEQAVLATKSFLSQVAWFYLLAHWRAGSNDVRQDILGAAQALEPLVQPNFLQEKIQPLAQALKSAAHLFVIGKGLGAPLALEAALKIKEVTYIHAEGFAAGELKHGVIALIETGTPCILLLPVGGAERQAVISAGMELKSRGAWIMCLDSGEVSDLPTVFDACLKLPNLGDLTILLQIVVIQQLAYALALELGNDPDKPRNLAKSVTVR